MSNHVKDLHKERTTPTGRPLQLVTWSEKIARDKEWFKQNADYYCGLANFNLGATSGNSRNKRVLYDVYNNKFPLEWFAHITDPLNARNPNHKKYPAKVRPTGMLRTNIDLLLGEYPKRPFVYQVQNMGEDAYNSYLENMKEAVFQNVQEHFLAIAQQSMSAAGYQFEEIPQEQEIELPESVQERFTASYKDALAIRAQKWINRAIREYHIRQKMLKMFKDWLIVGEARSYKNIENGNFVYDRVSPEELKYDKSPNIDFIEDGEWAVRRLLLTVSDCVDRFYPYLSKKEQQQLENTTHWASPLSMYNYLSANYAKDDLNAGLVPVFHITWKGRKPIKHITYTDPLTGLPQEMTVDEDTPIDDTMTVVKEEWVNEVYEVWRIGDDIYPLCQALPVQRNEMNNFSRCKLPYNGRNYSDTHSENISVMEMGLPLAIMYIITNYTLEKTLAKNKGKVALIDQNAIPQRDGWDDEKFFYYSDALGYMIVDRNQQGVDKSWNQYHVLDMSLWDQIKNLIELRNSFIDDWDKLLGINPQRKAQIGSSDGLGTTQTALFQSSVITDMIFSLFEEFTERELQGILDYSRFINVDGIRAIYNQDDFDRELLNIDPNSYCYAELGLFMTYSANEMQTLQQYRNQVQAMIQNGVKMSTILEIQRSNNVAELMTKLKRLEELEMQEAMAAQESQHEQAMALEEIKERHERLKSLLKIEELHEEWDRKDQNEMIKGEYQLFGFGGDGDNNDNGIPDAVEIGNRIRHQQQILSNERIKGQELAQKGKEHSDKMALENKKLRLEKEKIELERRGQQIEKEMQENEMKQQEKLNKQQLQLGEQKIRTAKIQARKAAQKPKPSSK
jgi:hypothetical protein